MRVSVQDEAWNNNTTQHWPLFCSGGDDDRVFPREPGPGSTDDETYSRARIRKHEAAPQLEKRSENSIAGNSSSRSTAKPNRLPLAVRMGRHVRVLV